MVSRQLKIQNSITVHSRDTLDKYLLEVSHTPLISIDEEIRLAQKIKRGGKEKESAVDVLVKANLRFVVSVAKQYQHLGLPIADLINEGNIGLIKAAHRYDETRGFKFISYAVWWIRQSIRQALADDSRLVRIPQNQLGYLSKIKQAASKFEQEHSLQPSVSELSQLTKMDEDQIRETLTVDGRHVSVDAPYKYDEESCMLDELSSGDDSLTDRTIEKESLSQEVNAILRSVLTDREVIIIREYFGIGCREKGLDEIAYELGITRERTRQIKEISIAKLRKSCKVKALMKYLG